MKIETINDASNFEIWKFEAKFQFKSKQSCNIITGEEIYPEEKEEHEIWNKKEAIVQRIIVTSISKQALSHILNRKTTKEMFKKNVKCMKELQNSKHISCYKISIIFNLENLQIWHYD